jgi:hypothetical protein
MTRWRHAALFVCAAAVPLWMAACRFSIPGIDATGAGDMATGSDDLAGGGGDLPACACATGCSDTPTPHCLALEPTGPVSAADYATSGLGTLTVTANLTVDSDTGAIMGPPSLMRPAGAGVLNGVGFRVAPQTGGPAIGVFSVAGLTLAAGVKITVTGANAFALVSAGAVTLNGLVDASCSGMMPGPGGFAGGMGGMDGLGPTPGAGKAGSATGAGPTAAASGGGGGAYGDAGGAGGLLTGATSNGGVPWGDLTPAAFVLVGGAGGGGGGQPMGGKGGNGGGAVQLAVNDTLTIGGTIDVGGCGGAHGAKASGGGGGGAGGAIVLEAARVTLTSTAVLAANGGGGGAGDDKSASGNDANASVVPAPGGGAGSATGGNGGNGGASNGMPGQHFTNGRNGTIPDPLAGFGGGGGGGVGRIVVRAQNPTMGGISDSSTAVTPDAGDLSSDATHPTVYGAASFQ